MLQRTAGHSTSASARARTAQVDEPRAAPGRLFPTKNDLPEATRSRIADLLNQRLADCIDLQTQCKQAHWNVKGQSFIGLHKLFDDVNEDVEEYVDLLAERVVQLGGIAQGTARSPQRCCPEHAVRLPTRRYQRRGARRGTLVGSGHLRSGNPQSDPAGG